MKLETLDSLKILDGEINILLPLTTLGLSALSIIKKPCKPRNPCSCYYKGSFINLLLAV